MAGKASKRNGGGNKPDATSSTEGQTTGESAPVTAPATPAPVKGASLSLVRAALAAAVVIAEANKPAEGEGFAVSGAPKVRSARFMEAKGGNDNSGKPRVIGANLAIEFEEELFASFPIQIAEDGTVTVATSQRAQNATAEHLAAIWSGKPGQKAADGGSCLLVGVPMGNLVPIARSLCEALTKDKATLAAFRDAGFVYDKDTQVAGHRTYLAVSLHEAKLPLFCFGQTQEDGSVKFLADDRRFMNGRLIGAGVWSLGEYGSRVRFGEVGNRFDRRRGSPMGNSRGYAARVMQTVINAALKVKDGETVIADALKEFKASGSPFFQRRFRSRLDRNLRAQAPIAEGMEPKAPQGDEPQAGDGSEELSFEAGGQAAQG